MRFLITGAAGSIGSHLCEHLRSAGHEVHGFDDFSVGKNRPAGVLIREIDVSRELLPLIHDIDVIVHAAALADIIPSIAQPRQYHDVNVTGTVRMLEYARQYCPKLKRFIYLASASCYGDRAATPTSELHPCRPRYPYAITKMIGEQYVLHYGKVYGLPFTSLRLFNVFGPRFRTAGTYGAVFGVFLAQLSNGLPLTVVGDGQQQRDFTYVSDVCRAIALAAEHPAAAGEVFNVGSGTPHSVNELIALLGHPETTRLPDRPGEPRLTFADTAKIRTRLGWRPEVSFSAGVARMLEHLEDYKGAPLWTPERINAVTEEWFTCLSEF